MRKRVLLSHVTTVRFTEGEWAELERLASEEDEHVAVLIRQAVREKYPTLRGGEQ